MPCGHLKPFRRRSAVARPPENVAAAGAAATNDPQDSRATSVARASRPTSGAPLWAVVGETPWDLVASWHEQPASTSATKRATTGRSETNFTVKPTRVILRPGLRRPTT